MLRSACHAIEICLTQRPLVSRHLHRGSIVKTPHLSDMPAGLRKCHSRQIEGNAVEVNRHSYIRHPVKLEGTKGHFIGSPLV
jgi:hypothetical protein